MFFEHIVSKANDIVIVAEIGEADGRFRIIYTNEAFSRVFGYSSEEALGQSPRMLQGSETDLATVDEISAAIHQGGSIRRRLLNYSKTGQIIWVEVNIVPLAGAGGRTTHFAAIERDVTDDVRRETSLEDLALTDALTGVGNRRFFERYLTCELSRSRRTGSPLALAIFDLDHFKSVNDRWGHQVGDGVLVNFVRAVHRSLRNYDYVARIGGEEFAIILPGAVRADAAQVIERICAGVRAIEFEVTDQQTIRVTCSAGLTSFDAVSDSPESLVARADRALYLAKASGRDKVVVLEDDRLLDMAG
jgi:diguanylate cyclase (GGDEF)-like protein/PAS domain S-box-containing protein